MTKKVLIIFAAVLVVVAFTGSSCTTSETTDTSDTTTTDSSEDAVTCTNKETNKSMTYGEAKQIAENSECTKEGSLKEEHQCNENTGTWWIDLDIKKEGCSPACVVSCDNKSAEINWRCTGLLPEE